MVKKLTAVILCICFAVMIAAYKEVYVYSEDTYDIWTAPSTVKVMLDDIGYPNKKPAAINLNCVKNEYESCQLFISAFANITSYDLETADLKSGDNKITKDNITVYNERFVNTTREEAYKIGWYPDALIPINYAKKAGEMNIKKNTNGVLWITFFIPKDTNAGTYTANFKLLIDGKSNNIPVTVKVNDYVLTDNINAKTNFGFRPNHLVSGELDNTVEMREEYYEFFLDYRIALWGLPVESDSAEENVEYALKYFDKTPCYNIDSRFIPALAAASTKEKNLLSKASLNFLDEIYMRYHSRDSVYSFMNGLDRIRALNMELSNYVTMIENDTSGKYDNFKQIEDWDKYITGIPNVVADHFNSMVEDRNKEEVVDVYLKLLSGYCPIWNTYTDNYRDLYLDMLSDYGAESWWYGCLAPVAPFATYHISDTNLLSSRTINWMQKKYDVIGNMYWGSGSYTEEEQGDITTFEMSINVYNDPYRIKKYYAPAGDGILCYPGAPYGHYGPFPSMRLMSIRDGYEEYEMLYDLENKYGILAEEYIESGEEIDIDLIMEVLYDKLYFNGIALYGEGQNGLDFYEVRNDLINSLLDVNNPCGFMMYKSINENAANITIYVNKDYTVKIDGDEIDPVIGSEVKYMHTKNLSEGSMVDIEVINKNDETEKYTFRKFLDYASELLYNFNEDTVVPEGITVTGESDSLSIQALHAASGNALKCVVSSNITGDVIDDLMYVPAVNILTSLFGDISFEDIAMLKFYVYNAGDYCNMYVRFSSGSYPSERIVFPLVSGVNQITVAVQDLNFSRIAEIDKLSIEFDNDGTQGNNTVYTVYLDNFYAVLKEN